METQSIKYFIGKIQECNGSMEYSTPVKFFTENGENPADILDLIAANWRSGNSPDGEGCYENDGTLTYAHGFEEISKKLFDTKIPYIYDLTNSAVPLEIEKTEE